MKVMVELFGDLRKYLPPGVEQLNMELEEGATVGDLIRRIELERGEIWGISIDGMLVNRQMKLADGNRVLLFPPIGGGSQGS